MCKLRASVTFVPHEAESLLTLLSPAAMLVKPYCYTQHLLHDCLAVDSNWHWILPASCTSCSNLQIDTKQEVPTQMHEGPLEDDCYI